MQLVSVSDKETKVTFDGSPDHYEVYNNGAVHILASTARGKRIKLHLEEWEVSELVKQLRWKGLL